MDVDLGAGEHHVRVVLLERGLDDVALFETGEHRPSPSDQDAVAHAHADVAAVRADDAGDEEVATDGLELLEDGRAHGAAVPVSEAAPPRAALSGAPAEAAAMPETLFTVWHNVFDRGLAGDGEVLLVHGGTSGIGTMAIALGKLFGLTVIVTCGSEAKCAAAKVAGADHAINYREADFAAEVREHLRRDGYTSLTALEIEVEESFGQSATYRAPLP